MEPRDGDGESRIDDAFDWEDETVETQQRSVSTSPEPSAHPPGHRTFRSDLDRLRHRVSPPILLGVGALLIAVIVIVAVLATRGGDDAETASPSESPSPPAAVEPEASPPGEAVSPEPPSASPSLSLSEDVTLQEGDEGEDVTNLQQGPRAARLLDGRARRVLW